MENSSISINELENLIFNTKAELLFYKENLNSKLEVLTQHLITEFLNKLYFPNLNLGQMHSSLYINFKNILSEHKKLIDEQIDIELREINSKIKFYFSVNANLNSKSEFDDVNVKLDLKINSIIKNISSRN